MMIVRLKALPGNSLLEYALPVAVFFLTGALALLSGMPDVMQAYFTDTVKGTQSGHSVVIAAYGSVGAAAQALTSSLPPETPSSTGNVQIITANGTTINLEGYSPLFSDSIETTGANGTTLSLYSSLMHIAQELESAGEVDAAQANLLRDLANQGHRIAEIEGLIETAAQQASSVAEYNSVDLTFDGQSYKTFELEALLGWSANGSATPENISSNALDATGASPETATFIALYESVLASGALDDPAVMGIVTGLSGEIAYLTELTEHASALVGREEKPLSEFNSTMVSETTHYDSELICNQGNGAEDTGVSCP